MATVPPRWPRSHCGCDCHLEWPDWPDVPGRVVNPQDKGCPECTHHDLGVWLGTLAPSVHAGILTPEDPDPDPDPEGIDMTTIPAPDTTTPDDTVAEPVIHSLVRSEETLIARDGPAVTTLLDVASAHSDTAPFVQKARKAEATGSVGLYIEAVAHTSSGTPFSHMKFFVVGGYVYVYSRNTGDARANWRTRETPDVASALLIVQAAIDKDAVKIYGHPVLVELTADDISAVESGQIPPARFRGEYRIQRDYGRYDFAKPVVTAPVPGTLSKALRNPRWVSTHEAI